MSDDTPGESRAEADRSKPSQRRDVDERAVPHQEAEDTTASDDRVTSPMQSFSTSQVGVGVVVLLVGLLITFGIPLLLV